MDYGELAATIVQKITKSLMEEYIICWTQMANNYKIISNTKDINVATNAQEIARYYQIRLQTILDIMERISNIMSEEGVETLNSNEMLSIFGCSTQEELAYRCKDPKILAELIERLKDYIKEKEKE